MEKESFMNFMLPVFNMVALVFIYMNLAISFITWSMSNSDIRFFIAMYIMYVITKYYMNEEK